MFTLLQCLSVIYAATFVAATCYFENGSVATNYGACSPQYAASQCCAAGEYCSSANLCISIQDGPAGSEEIVPSNGACTDQSWSANACGKFCLTSTSPSYNGTVEVCQTTQTTTTACCWSNGLACDCQSNLMSLGPLSIFAAIKSDLLSYGIPVLFPGDSALFFNVSDNVVQNEINIVSSQIATTPGTVTHISQSTANTEAPRYSTSSAFLGISSSSVSSVSSSYTSYPQATASTPTSTPTPKPVPAGAIAGGVIGGVVVLALIAGAIVHYNRRRKQGPSGEHGSVVNNEAGARYSDAPKVPEMSGGEVRTGISNNSGQIGQGKDEVEYML